MAIFIEALPEKGKFVYTILGLAIVLGVLALHVFAVKIDVREPPVVYPKIPLIGHLIGLVRDGPLYLKKLTYVGR